MKTTLFALAALLTFSTAWANSLVGVGLMLRRAHTNDPVIVQQIVPNSPAWKAGIKPNSRLASIDGADIADMSLAKCVDLIRGESDTQVTLGIVDPAGQQTNLVTLTRATIQLPNPAPGKHTIVRRPMQPGAAKGMTGVIIGCVIGIIGGLVALGAGTLYWYKKR